MIKVNNNKKYFVANRYEMNSHKEYGYLLHKRNNDKVWFGVSYPKSIESKSYFTKAVNTFKRFCKYTESFLLYNSNINQPKETVEYGKVIHLGSSELFAQRRIIAINTIRKILEENKLGEESKYLLNKFKKYTVFLDFITHYSGSNLEKHLKELYNQKFVLLTEERTVKYAVAMANKLKETRLNDMQTKNIAERFLLKPEEIDSINVKHYKRPLSPKEEKTLISALLDKHTDYRLLEYIDDQKNRPILGDLFD